MKLSIKVKPGSRQEKVEKTIDGYIAYVKEQPLENKANRALVKLLSEYFNIPKSRIMILSGLKAKKKIIEIKKFSAP